MTSNVVSLSDYRRAKQRLEYPAVNPLAPAFAMWSAIFSAYAAMLSELAK